MEFLLCDTHGKRYNLFSMKLVIFLSVTCSGFFLKDMKYQA